LPLICYNNPERICNLRQTEIKGSLIKPVSLTPAEYKTPSNRDTPNCLVESSAPSWNLEEMLYHRTAVPRTIQGQFSMGSQFEDTFYAVIHNNANNLTVSCRIDANSVDFGWNQYSWNLCDSPKEHTNDAFSPYRIKTYVMVDTEDRVFHVNQTWYCNDPQGGPP
jgi:hypothetical protein